VRYNNQEQAVSQDSKTPPALSLNDRARGCLIGAAIGAELGYARRAHPQRFRTNDPDELFKRGGTGYTLRPMGLAAAPRLEVLEPAS
jgi:hypothetical protein